VPGGFAGTQIFCPECGAGFRLRAAAPTTVRPPPPAPTADDDLPTDAHGVPQYPCAMCGGSFPPERVYNANGLVLCHNCYARSVDAPAARPAGSEPSAAAAAPSRAPQARERAPLLVAVVGGVLALAPVAFVIGRQPTKPAGPGATTPHAPPV
jgi:hypothetical protein